ncbi:MAG: ATP-binding protein [Treponema sp.]|nr:ATP-binding protein [Treponema sp.]
MTELKRFPIGLQDFAQIRRNGYYYVDKTAIIYEMVSAGRVYFLSRPRRFGKSLLVSTLKCYFEGRKDLFEGLAIERMEKEWKKHPVFHVSFSITKYSDVSSLQIILDNILAKWENLYGITNTCGNEWGPRFANVIEAAHEKTGEEPVVLVDEYDAPLLDTMDDPEMQKRLKLEMRKFFSPLKDLGGILRFVFLTGITKFSQLSIFSELNNLKIITMNDSYASICGITKEELLSQMKPEIQALADKRGLTYEGAVEALRKKYDGYHFSEESPDVYNPFSLINALTDKKLDNYWFSTGTPTVLTHLIKKYDLNPDELDRGFPATTDMFDAPAEEAKDPVPMLYQSGYVTIKDYDGYSYTLGFPNEEVRYGFLHSLMPYYAAETVSQNDTFLLKFSRSLREGNLDDAMALMRSFFSSIPYNAEKQDENHYKTIFFLIARLCTPFVVHTEEASAAGRSDMTVETQDAVYVFEFKLDGTVEEALAQIDSKGYLIPYEASVGADGRPKKLFKIGASFDAQTRTLGGWKAVEG